MHQQFIYKQVGNFKLSIAAFIFCLFSVSICFANEDSVDVSENDWTQFEKRIEDIKKEDRRNGMSYIVSGSLALLGGIAGQNLTTDPLEKGIYTLFQTLGVASIGYGAYAMQIGSNDRSLYEMISGLDGFSNEQKSKILLSYQRQQKEKLEKERQIKAITHGLIALLNLYNASQQNDESVKNTLYFVGGVNLLATLSYTF